MPRILRRVRSPRQNQQERGQLAASFLLTGGGRAKKEGRRGEDLGRVRVYVRPPRLKCTHQRTPPSRTAQPSFPQLLRILLSARVRPTDEDANTRKVPSRTPASQLPRPTAQQTPRIPLALSSFLPKARRVLSIYTPAPLIEVSMVVILSQ